MHLRFIIVVEFYCCLVISTDPSWLPLSLNYGAVTFSLKSDHSPSIYLPLIPLPPPTHTNEWSFNNVYYVHLYMC